MRSTVMVLAATVAFALPVSIRAQRGATLSKAAAGACDAIDAGQWDGGSDDEPDAPTGDAVAVMVLCGNAADFVRPQ